MFADPIRHWRLTRPEKIAVVDRSSGNRYSYAELDDRIDRTAAELRALGVNVGDRVGVLAMNRIEHIDLFYGCHRIGAALVPLNWRLRPSELAPVVEHAEMKVVFGEQRFRALAEDAATTLHWVDLDLDARQRADAIGDARNDANTPALILFTSGSTGSPKGAILPHRQILFNAIATTTAWELTSDDVAPITTPFFHTGGWNVFATPLFMRGGTIVLVEKFEAGEFMRMMVEEGCTVALTVPTQLTMLLESQEWGVELPRLRSFFSGGAPCPTRVLEQVRAAGYPIREGYGLTECGPNCFTIAPEQAPLNAGAVGWPVPFLEMRTVDEDLRDVPKHEVGELLLRGPQMFAGYLNDMQRTNEAIIQDGWLRTGDLARRLDNGMYAIVGRRKEMYISGGENVYPAEVESILCNCPGVAEVAVIGIPDERWGEVGRAFVVRAAGSAIDQQALLDYAQRRLAKYKTPTAFVFLDTLPRLGSGKIDRRTLLSWQ